MGGGTKLLRLEEHGCAGLIAAAERADVREVSGPVQEGREASPPQ